MASNAFALRSALNSMGSLLVLLLASLAGFASANSVYTFDVVTTICPEGKESGTEKEVELKVVYKNDHSETFLLGVKLAERGKRYVSKLEITHNPENIKEVELRYQTGFLGREDSFCVKDMIFLSRFYDFCYVAWFDQWIGHEFHDKPKTFEIHPIHKCFRPPIADNTPMLYIKNEGKFFNTC